MLIFAQNSGCPERCHTVQVFRPKLHRVGELLLTFSPALFCTKTRSYSWGTISPSKWPRTHANKRTARTQLSDPAQLRTTLPSCHPLQKIRSLSLLLPRDRRKSNQPQFPLPLHMERPISGPIFRTFPRWNCQEV